MQGWDEVRRWRKERRADLIERRQAMPQDERRRLQPLILNQVEQHFCETLSGALLGFYWPFRGEIGAHELIRRLIERGAQAALPVVVEKNQPLEFWAWRPGQALERGVWNIPIPVERKVVQPTALLAPLVGFDAEGYRLGYGGGYYDRTLAAMATKPLTIGLGYELGRLSTTHPQPHDIQMDVIVTETGMFRSPPRGGRHGAAGRGDPISGEDPEHQGAYASPPCFMHELDPSYLGLQPSGDAEPGAPKTSHDQNSEDDGGTSSAAHVQKAGDR